MQKKLPDNFYKEGLIENREVIECPECKGIFTPDKVYWSNYIRVGFFCRRCFKKIGNTVKPKVDEILASLDQDQKWYIIEIAYQSLKEDSYVLFEMDVSDEELSNLTKLLGSILEE